MIHDSLPALKAWAHNLKNTVGTDGVYLFGSLVYREGEQVVDSTDIDLVVRFPSAAITALDRLRWLEALYVAKRDLELTLSKILKRDKKKQICSLVVPTAIEIRGNIHKDAAHELFSSQPFFDLLAGREAIGISGAGSNPVLEGLAIQCLRFAQKKRNQYLDVTASGLTSFTTFDGDDPLPKEFMRHAAIASSLSMPSPPAGSQYDVQFGLDFVSNGLYGMRHTDDYIQSIHNRLSIRRNARPARGQVITPRDQVFLAEWIFDQVIETLCLKHYARETLSEKAKSVLMNLISLDLDRRGWAVEDCEMGQGCTNPNFNTKLVNLRPVVPLVRPTDGRWLAYNYYSSDLLAFALAEARKSGDVFNDSKIRLASDLTEEGKVEAIIQETDYFSSLMTDQLAWKSVRSKHPSLDGGGPNEVLWHGTSAFIEVDAAGSAARLKEFGEAAISNQMGASTLAFSSDGHLMVVYQNRRNQQSKDMLAPSGSGSLDWKDVAASNAADLLSLVMYGAERELREECSLDEHTDDRGRHWPKVNSKIMVTGFARMLHRAGKPEFFCLGYIAETSDRICERKPERYVEYVMRAPVECANWSAGKPSDEIRRVCEGYRGKKFKVQDVRIAVSYPLEHALKLLIGLCEKDSTARVLDSFIRTALSDMTDGGQRI